MLRIVQNSSASGAKSYYSTADYFTEGQELQGVWRGKAAEHLGLGGIIKKRDWDALCENLHPGTGQALTVRRKQDRRVGWDFNFSVPKSVSLLFAINQDERIVHAFEDAVDETMRDVEQDLHTRIRRNGQNSDRQTGNGVWGRFIHFTSRPIDGVPDPQMHAHCFLFNTTFDSCEVRWKAAQIGAVKRDANYYSALMHSRLAAKLVELGIPVERTAKCWGIAGISEATQAKFSRRTQQIEELAAERGITDPEEKAALGAKTRQSKNKGLTIDELRTLWKSWLSDEEAKSLQLLKECQPGSRLPFSGDRARSALAHAAEHHFERESVVPERKLLATALHRAIGEATPEMVLSEHPQTDLIVGEQNGRRMVTSPAVLAAERRIIEFAQRGRDACAPLAPGEAEPSRQWLNDGQRKALAHLCASRDRVQIMRGVAGSGKTSLLSEAVERIERHGKKVFLFAPSAQASRGVLRAEGFKQAETVAHLLANRELQSAIHNNVILIDEAGLVGMRTMAQVFDLAERAHARVILSGDKYQHKSVEAGSALKLLEEEAGIRSAELSDIVRQKDRYKDAVAHLSQGRVEAGFKVLDELGWIHEIANSQERYERIAAEYVETIKAGKSVIAVSPTHSECQRVTKSIRLALKEKKMLGRKEHEVLKLVSRRLTVAERSDGVHLVVGDAVIFTQNAKGYHKGTRLTVGIDAIPLELAARFDVFRPEKLGVAKGDLIRITAGSSSAEGKRLENGQQYRVRRIARDGTITLNNGWHLGPCLGFLDHAYCSTSHSAQGKTRDRVIVAESSESFSAASRQQAYVSISRGRQACSIFTDQKATLLEAMMESDDGGSATELARTRSCPAIERNRLVNLSMTTGSYAPPGEVQAHDR